MKRFSLLVFAFSCLIAAPTMLQGADWPGWRKEGGPPKLWSYENAGLGYGGPAIVGKHMFLLGTRDESEVLIAIEIANGKESWATPLGSILNNGWGNGPRSTPAVDGNRVYALSGRGELVCADIQTGKKIWQIIRE